LERKKIVCQKNIKKKLASNVFVPTNTKNHQHSISEADGFLLVGSSPKPFGNTENFCGYAPIAALKNMTEAAVSYSLCCI